MFITLAEASDRLIAKGLVGQTPHVLRKAIAAGTLDAVRDGHVWRTTIEKLEVYEASLWQNSPPPPSVDPRRYTKAQRDAAAVARLKEIFGTPTPSEAQVEALLGHSGEGLATRYKDSPALLLSEIQALIALRER